MDNLKRFDDQFKTFKKKKIFLINKLIYEYVYIKSNEW